LLRDDVPVDPCAHSAAAVQRFAGGTSMSEEMRYRVLRLLQTDPKLSQRDVARKLGISLGKVNFCLQALISKGWVKATNFKNSHNKAAYMYVLTPRGMEAKARLAVRFLVQKLSEYERLREEIEQIRREAERGRAD
jgi:EPS-associated MarR family transcriptional regulator